MILHVAGREVLRLLAFKLVKEHRRGLAQGIDQHVEATPVGHADDHVVNAETAGHAHHFVHGDHQRFAAFEREAFLSDVAGVQVALQGFGSGQAFQEAQFLRGGVGAAGVIRFDARLNPLALADAFQVHVFDADRAAIGFLDGIKNLAEGCAFGNALEGAGVEDGVDVSARQAVEGGIQFGEFRTALPLQGIEVGPQGTEGAVGGDHLQHASLLLVVNRLCGSCPVAATLCLLGKGGDNRLVRHVTGDRCRQLHQLVKIIPPFARDGGGIVEVILVKLFHKRRVTAEKMGSAEKLVHHGAPVRWLE